MDETQVTYNMGVNKEKEVHWPHIEEQHQWIAVCMWLLEMAWEANDQWSCHHLDLLC